MCKKTERVRDPPVEWSKARAMKATEVRNGIKGNRIGNNGGRQENEEEFVKCKRKKNFFFSL